MATNTLSTLASGAVTATGNTGAFSGFGVDSADISIAVTAVSGTTPSCTFKLEKQGDDGNWYALWTSSAVTATTTISTNVANGSRICGSARANLRLSWTITGTTPSFTFSASVVGRP